jgi:sulfatase maturation enzyme AslB (radical SAM superfamily)
VKIDNSPITSAGNKNYNLVSFDWSVIDLCNYNCSYCFAGFDDIDKNKRSIFHKDKNIKHAYKSVLSKLSLPRLPRYEVSLVGGEPTLHPHIDEIVTTLCKNDNCIDVSIITNTHKSIEYFEQLSRLSLDKLTICSSIHVEYHKDRDLEKYLHLKNINKIKYQPLVMLHDSESYYSKTVEILDFFISNNIEYSVTFIEDTHNYKPVYSDQFYRTFEHYLKLSTNNTFEFYTGNKMYEMSRESINTNGYKRFKGWKCRPMLWTIDVNGTFTNACTDESPNYILSDLTSHRTCPLSECTCDVKWRFPKEVK